MGSGCHISERQSDKNGFNERGGSKKGRSIGANRRSGHDILWCYGLTVIEALVAAGMVALEMLVAVTVQLPGVLRIICCCSVPPDKPASKGMIAPASVLVRLIVPLPELTTCQFASTALMVTVTTLPAGTGSGVPTLPVTVSGMLVSPGNSP